MKFIEHITQHPDTGSRTVMFRGDTITFRLSIPGGIAGTAWIRTNIGHAETARRAIIDEVVKNVPGLGLDWFDIPMKREATGDFLITLPLIEVGHFEAKCFFMPEGEVDPVWPEGPNTVINVEPADTCYANTIYNAFVRQFGKNKDGSGLPDAADKNCINRLDEKGYTVIPQSGTFRDLAEELDFIIDTLGCRIIQLLPINPTPTTYGRMGRFGSPYASLSFTGVDPALAVFDPKATPLEQFTELVDAVHARNALITIDMAVNHTGWAAGLHETHPEWLKRDPEGEIQMPGAWGVTWADLTSLDYSKKDLWQYIADVLLTWCKRGVDGFRCDAGYMIPMPAWRYIIAKVRDQYPDTIFLLEGLGGKLSVTRELLNLANFNWAYSELFQNYDRAQVEHYLPQALEISAQDGLAVHFAETHDNNRLASRSKTYAMMRTALCALASQRGGFGFANGVEWFADAKIDVHEAPPLNWGNDENQVKHIRRLNTLLRTHPVFFENVDITFIQQQPGNYIVLLRSHVPSGKKLIIAVNLSDTDQVRCTWRIQPDMPGPGYIDLLTGTTVEPGAAGNEQWCDLLPGQVLCLSADNEDLGLMEKSNNFSLPPPRLTRQCLRAKVMEILCCYGNTFDIADVDFDRLARKLAENPVDLCRSMNPENPERKVVKWQWPTDLKREVMVPPGHSLMVCSPYPFRIRLDEETRNGCRTVACEKSLPLADRTFFTLITPIDTPESGVLRLLRIVVYGKNGSRHEKASILFTGSKIPSSVDTVFTRTDLSEGEHLFLSANGAGAVCRANARWGKLSSKYDALLAANLNPSFPEDRRIMFTRCRAWIVFQGYSQEICFDCLDRFGWDANRGYWIFKVPTGQGQSIDLMVSMALDKGKNLLGITFARILSDGRSEKLPDKQKVRLILRPDIEDRNFHDVTKAFTGPENAWPAAVKAYPDGFDFTPAHDRRLSVRLPGGTFVHEPEWYYMVYHPLEEERGLDPLSDLFSPGYLSLFLKGGESACLTASVNEDPACDLDASLLSPPRTVPLEKVLRDTLSAYVVRRDPLKSIIAGYPWFLDWGRDSLIVARGLIAADMTENALSVIKQFGRFESCGTLPNMIHAGDPGNRDTSDAPLWFAVAVADMLRHGHGTVLYEKCGDRTIEEILLSIGRSYVNGTPNGIRMDAVSGLVYSPAHFTWMDTNYPACTPRQGYCIEIQALWHFTLELLAMIDPGGPIRWENLAEQVKRSVMELFVLENGSLADCIYAGEGVSAKEGELDDSLRPNQILAITLGTVKDRQLDMTILDACSCLLVPGAIRSLADAPVNRPLEIVVGGTTIGDPLRPYRGRYTGDEDTSRKPAYHNGTAWTWLFPSYCEAWAMVYGDEGKSTARSFLSSSLCFLRTGCVGHFPEITDGDFPHAHRGCDAQAWGVSEWIRVWKFLESA